MSYRVLGPLNTTAIFTAAPSAVLIPPTQAVVAFYVAAIDAAAVGLVCVQIGPQGDLLPLAFVGQSFELGSDEWAAGIQLTYVPGSPPAGNVTLMFTLPDPQGTLQPLP